MQKKIIALAIAAAFAAPVAATADSMFYGSMDGGLRHQTNNTTDPTVTGANGGGGTTDSMKMGQYNTSRWGFKGVDDLGDGMKANVVVETGFVPYGVGGNPDMNSAAPSDFTKVNMINNPFGLIFDRQATVGLEGGWGKFDMGWNYTTAFNVIKTYDPFDYKFLGVALAKNAGVNLMVADNSGTVKATAVDRMGNVTYSNKMGDLTVMVEYDIANAYQSRQATNGTGRAVGFTYVAGDINIGGEYSAKEGDAYDQNASTPTHMTYDNASNHMTFGAGYNYGAGKLSVGYAKNAIKTAANDNTATNMWFGGNYNVSDKVVATAAYYSKVANKGGATDTDATTKVTMAMATYAMTKKTTLYVEADRTVTNTGAANASDVVTSGFSAGLDVKF